MATTRSDSIKPAITELERIFVNMRSLFSKTEREMPLPVITIADHGRSKSLGHFWADKWENKQGKLPEINIAASHLNANVSQIAHIMIHEMVHYSNWLDKINDCSNSGYHNMNFKTLCEKVGLNCEKDGRRGWSKTSLTDHLKFSIDLLDIREDAFGLYRKGLISKDRKKQPTKMKKWTCGCTNIRCAVELRAWCQQPGCGNNFIKVTKRGDDETTG